MFDNDEWVKMEPYSMNKTNKKEFLTHQLKKLTTYHMDNCEPYRNMMQAVEFFPDAVVDYAEIPYLPVRLFKEMDLKSISQNEVVKTMTSSGTTGQQVSKIYIDKETSSLQTKVLTNIVGDFIGKKRLPMIILDTSAVVKNRQMFSARGAGILGFSIFGRDKIYALDENMKLDVEGLKAFLEKHQGEKIFLFGFTFMIWEHFCAELEKLGYYPDLSQGILIHGGGWKKLASHNVSANEFKMKLKEVCGLTNIHDYYGMVEQTGTIYMECECGYLHSSIFSDIIVRSMKDFAVAKQGEEGIIEVVSVLPKSYPGHVLLTEDQGMILGEDDCPCGRLGKYFKITGRIKSAEIRGCSDTYAAGK